MGDKTNISWTDATWTTLTGCDHVSPGCENCYSAGLTATRLAHLPQYAGLADWVDGRGRFNGTIRLLPERLDRPLRWTRPRKIFVNSMSDTFHKDVPDKYIADMFDIMLRASQHTFQVLTKRPQRMAQLLRRFRTIDGESWYVSTDEPGPSGLCDQMEFPNVWLGSSVENDTYTFRADHVRRTPAAVRFLSLEPLLGPVPSLDLTGIDWAIVGGESGRNARPMEEDWVREIAAKCAESGTALWVKQMGAVWADRNGVKAPAHTMSEFPADLRVQNYPVSETPIELKVRRA